MSEYRPGPWKADKNDAEPFYRITDAADGSSVAKVDAHWSRGDLNALIIAAAPAMLELLRRSQPYDTHQHVDALSCWNCKVKRLLARIDGKEGT